MKCKLRNLKKKKVFFIIHVLKFWHFLRDKKSQLLFPYAEMGFYIFPAYSNTFSKIDSSFPHKTSAENVKNEILHLSCVLWFVIVQSSKQSWHKTRLTLKWHQGILIWILTIRSCIYASYIFKIKQVDFYFTERPH